VQVVDRDGRFDQPADRPVIATIGNFDGLHRGHRAIMDRIVTGANERSGIATVLTFDPHPLSVLAHDRAPGMILAREQKLEMLERWGVDAVVDLPFDHAMANMTPEEFVDAVLVGQVRVSEVHVGVDFRFARNRSGSVQVLQRLGADRGFTAATVPAVLEGGERISASRIRRLLGEGAIDEVNLLLGRSYELVGMVVAGAGRGKGLDFPTANVAPRNEVLPARGVYVTETRWGDDGAFGLTNVGVRPTFGEDALVVETYLPDFDGDLYGREVQVAFLRRVRDELAFPSPEALKEQIRRDLEVFRAFIASRR
jgi:riboflavin kinase/FMN adenylyltransferase